MTKVNRREAIVLLLGASVLGGCSHLRVNPAPELPAPSDPSLPRLCVWEPLSYQWNCIDYNRYLPLMGLASP